MKFSMTVPVQTNEYMLTVRLAVGAICEAKGFDIDSAEDYKVSVNESILILQRGGYRGVTLVFEEENGLKVSVSGEEKGESEKDEIENEISYALLGALVDEVAVERENGAAKRIVLNKSL